MSDDAIFAPRVPQVMTYWILTSAIHSSLMFSFIDEKL